MLHKKNNPIGVASEKISVRVTGMMCASCVRHVEKALLELDGVSGASASLEDGQVTLEYDPAKVRPDDMKRAIEAVGYKVP